MFSNNSCICRKRKFYYIIFFGVCVGGFKNFFGFLEIWCEMLGMEGSGGADMAQSIFTNYVKSADTARRVPTEYVTKLQKQSRKTSCRNEMISEPLPHKADPTEHSWRGVLWRCRDTACRVRYSMLKKIPRWKRSTGTFPNSRRYKRDTGRSGLVRSALEKLSLFSPTFSVRQKHGAGNFAVCGQRLRGHVPSKNTSPAALSWSSLFGDSFLKLFCFLTMVFAVCALKHPDNFPLLKSTDTARRVPTAHAKCLAN